MSRLLSSIFLFSAYLIANVLSYFFLVSRAAVRMLGGASAHAIALVIRGLSALRRRLAGPATMWGVTPILTIRYLAAADRLLELKSDSLVFSQYSIFSSFSRNYSRFDQRLERLPALRSLFRYVVFLRALASYDVFHYFLDGGFLPHGHRFGFSSAETDLLRRTGKSVIGYAYGADVRTRTATEAMGAPNACVLCPAPGVHCICDTAQHAELFAQWKQSGFRARAMLDMIDHVPDAEPFFYWPVDTKHLVPLPHERGDRLRIVHASNHPEFKGTNALIEAVDALIDEGHDIELVTIKNKPRKDALNLMRSADIVADQFLIGAYGYTALEAMSLGKPVMVYMRWKERIRAVEDCPLILTSVDQIKTTLEAALAGKIDLPARGRAGRAYVEKYHSLERVAVDLAADYRRQGSFPQRHLKRIETNRDRLLAQLDAISIPDWTDHWTEKDTGR